MPTSKRPSHPECLQLGVVVPVRHVRAYADLEIARKCSSPFLAPVYRCLAVDHGLSGEFGKAHFRVDLAHHVTQLGAGPEKVIDFFDLRQYCERLFADGLGLSGTGARKYTRVIHSQELAETAKLDKSLVRQLSGHSMRVGAAQAKQTENDRYC